MTLINDPDYAFLVTPPEEAALAAWGEVVNSLVNELGISVKQASMSLSDRILSNNKIVGESVKKIADEKNCVYLKGPGITPKDWQVKKCITFIEKAGSDIFKNNEYNKLAAEVRKEHKPSTGWTQESLESFSEDIFKKLTKIGSPNAIWRDINMVNLFRGASENMVQNSLAQTANINSETPLFISAAPADNIKNARVADKSKVSFHFVADDGIETEIGKQANLSAGSSLRIINHNEEKIKQWCEETLQQNPDAEFVHGTKQTVLKTTNNKLIKWMNEVFKKTGRQGSIAEMAATPKGEFNDLLVDDLFARLSTYPPQNKTVVLAADSSNADYIKEVWDNIKTRGGLKIPANGEVGRASATQDHYSAVESEAVSNGRVEARDENGKVLLSQEIKKGDVFMLTFLDKERAEGYVKQSLERAIKTGKTKVLFGFDENSEYYSIAVDALNKISPDYKDKLQIEVGKPAELTARYFTGEGDNALLCLSNIHGDFATDIELTGKGTSFSEGSIPGARPRKAIELGTGGTAPDLTDDPKKLMGWKREGYLKFNPMAFIEAVGQGIKGLADLARFDNKEELAKSYEVMAKAVDEAIYQTTKQGIVVPIIKGKFKKNKDAQDQIVSTKTFVAAVKYNTLINLKEKGFEISDPKINSSKENLDKLIAVDKAIIEINNGEHGKEFRELNNTYNEAREKNGHINPFNPNYDIELPLEQIKDLSNITAKNILTLQKSRVDYIKAQEEKNKTINAEIDYISVMRDFGVNKHCIPNLKEEQIAKDLTQKMVA